MVDTQLNGREHEDYEEKTFDAVDEELDNVTSFVNDKLDEAGCSVKTQMQIAVSLEEAFVNVAHYAYGDTVGKVTIGVSAEGGNAYIRMADSGMKFDPLKKDDPDITLSAEERNIGGLGIFMVKKIMDSVSYEYVNGENVLIMEKRFM